MVALVLQDARQVSFGMDLAAAALQEHVEIRNLPATVRLDSGLGGLEINLPEPLAKDADEVRALRRAVCDAAGNDVDRLCDELVKVEQEYRTRTGRFADVPREATENPFPEAATRPADPPGDDVRRVRRSD